MATQPQRPVHMYWARCGARLMHIQSLPVHPSFARPAGRLEYTSHPNNYRTLQHHQELSLLSMLLFHARRLESPGNRQWGLAQPTPGPLLAALLINTRGRLAVTRPSSHQFQLYGINISSHHQFLDLPPPVHAIIPLVLAMYYIKVDLRWPSRGCQECFRSHIYCTLSFLTSLFATVWPSELPTFASFFFIHFF